MDEMNFSDMCIEAARLAEQELEVSIPLVDFQPPSTIVDVGLNEWGLRIEGGSSNPKSAHIVYADSDGDLYTSRGVAPRHGRLDYSDDDARACARAFIEQIGDVKQRVADKQTDKKLTRI